MIRLDTADKNFENDFAALQHRTGSMREIEENVAAIINRVRTGGNKALVQCALEFDKAVITEESIRITEAEFKEAAAKIAPEDAAAINAALANVQAFARKKLPENWFEPMRDGVSLGEQFRPLDRVGVYIPGGTAPLVSTVIHTAGIAAAAGVKEIVAVTPPGRNGAPIHPEVLYAMQACGVTEAYRLGGVYGVAALACGTETIKKVEKIAGPGNAYVTCAKKLLYGEVAIDMVAGPSEIMIVADADNDPACLAADMLSQAEHGSGLEQAVIVSTSAELLDNVEKEILRQKKELSRIETVDRVLEKGVFLILASSRDEAIELAGRYAPEHLEMCVADPLEAAGRVTAAGAIFIGPYTPEPIGDFCAGPSHVLPTAGSAKFFAGLSVDSFFRRSSLVMYSRDAIRREGPIAARFAAMEGLDAHGRSAMSRS